MFYHFAESIWGSFEISFFLFWGILFYFFCYWDVWWGMTNYGLFSYLLPLFFFFIPDKSFWILEQIWQWPYAGFGPNLAWMRLESASLRTCELPTSTHQSFSTNWDQNISDVINQSFSHTEPGRVLPLLVGVAGVAAACRGGILGHHSYLCKLHLLRLRLSANVNATKTDRLVFPLNCFECLSLFLGLARSTHHCLRPFL